MRVERLEERHWNGKGDKACCIVMAIGYRDAGRQCRLKRYSFLSIFIYI